MPPPLLYALSAIVRWMSPAPFTDLTGSIVGIVAALFEVAPYLRHIRRSMPAGRM